MITLLEKDMEKTTYNYKIRALAEVSTVDAFDQYDLEYLSVDCEIDQEYNYLSLPSLNTYINDATNDYKVAITNAYVKDSSFDMDTLTGNIDCYFEMTTNNELSDLDLLDISTGVSEYLAENNCMLIIQGEYTSTEEYNDEYSDDYFGERETSVEVDETSYLYVDGNAEFTVLSKQEV